MYKAEGLGRRLQADPQMQRPRRPRFSEDYLVVPLGPEGLLVAGAEKREIFRGRSASRLLPRLLPLLDGTRRASDLAEALPGLSAAVIEDVLGLLYLRGLLEEGAGAADAAPLDEDARRRHAEQLAFFGRYTDVNRINPNRHAAQRRLGRSRVLVLAHEAFGAQVARGLSEAGAGACTLVALASRLADEGAREALRAAAAPVPLELLEHEGDLAVRLAGLTLVVACAEGEPVELWASLDAACRAAGVPWLRASLAGGRLQLGPRFAPSETACYLCARRFLEAAASEPPSALASRAAAGLIEIAALMELTGLFTNGLANRARSVDLAECEVSYTNVLRLPRCGRCGPGATSQDRLSLPDDLPVLFHLHSNHKWEGMAPKSHQTHYAAQVTELTRGAYKTYALRPRLALTPVRELPALEVDLACALTEPAQPHARPNLAHVAALCGWSAGWKAPGPFPCRYTPSGGSLCSCELYVLAWDVDGLEPGLYHYQAKDHQLEHLESGDPRPALRAALGPAEGIERASFAFVQTSELMRLFAKYGARAYRYAHLDVGVMTQSLRLFAQALGLRAWNTGHFVDDAVSDLLGVSRREFPSQVVCVEGRCEDGRTA